MKNENGLQIYSHDGENYLPLHDYGAWRVALLNFAPRFTREGLTYLERHRETDEVFVLLKGEATLYTGEEMAQTAMEYEKIYNVPAGVWHAITVSADAKVLVVENADTTRENSDRLPLPGADG